VRRFAPPATAIIIDIEENAFAQQLAAALKRKKFYVKKISTLANARK